MELLGYVSNASYLTIMVGFYLTRIALSVTGVPFRSIITFIGCIMSFMWRAQANLPPDFVFKIPPSAEFSFRIFICAALGIGIGYGILIFATFRRYGTKMDEAWRRRVEPFIDVLPYCGQHNVQSPDSPQPSKPHYQTRVHSPPRLPRSPSTRLSPSSPSHAQPIIITPHRVSKSEPLPTSRPISPEESPPSSPTTRPGIMQSQVFSHSEAPYPESPNPGISAKGHELLNDRGNSRVHTDMNEASEGRGRRHPVPRHRHWSPRSPLLIRIPPQSQQIPPDAPLPTIESPNDAKTPGRTKSEVRG